MFCRRNLEVGQLEWTEAAVALIESHLWLLHSQARQLLGKRKVEQTGCNWRLDNAEEEEQEEEEEEGPSVEECRGPLVDLRSDLAPLPPRWEQFLDLQTGEIYFVDWSACKRTKIDPRKRRPVKKISLEGSGSQVTEEEEGVSECLSVCGNLAKEEEKDAEVESPYNNTSIIAPSKKDCILLACKSEMEGGDDPMSSKTEMVVRGCHYCLHYVLHPKDAPLCPNCNCTALVGSTSEWKH